MAVSRRDLLAVVAAGSGTVTGCLTGQSESPGATTTATTTTEATTTATTTTEATTTATTTTAETTTAGASVLMQDRSFSPRTVSIEPGATVTWSNSDTYGHDIKSARFHDEAAAWDFETETIEAGGSVSYTFEETGVYEYYCTIHGQSAMCGAVLVGAVSLPRDLPCSGGYR